MSKNSSGNTPHISTEGVMREIEKTKSEVEAKQAELVKELHLLRGLKKPGTVIFFDLVGSTGYRRRYGSELGLMKAFLHNRTVTEAIERAGGRMVKWMGDGVLGCFSSERCGENHAFQALRAALGALQAIKALNQSDLLQTLFSAEKGEAYKESDHEVHTKIALCAGSLHYFELKAKDAGTDRNAQGEDFDPMGSSVDLASRLCHLAEGDSILIDKTTFLGTPVGSEEPIRGVVRLEKDEIVNWRLLKLEKVRRTVYVPQISAFLVEQQADGDMIPCRIVNSASEKISSEEIVKQALRDRNHNGNKDRLIVYAINAVPCNVPGFEEPVLALALSLEPKVQPIKHNIHSWEPDELLAELRDAELAYRKGGAANLQKAAHSFEGVLAKDPRNFQSNMRLAMIDRANGHRTEAMQHLMSAKRSNPDCPLAWAVAGMTHLDELFHNECDRSVGLSRAITGFSRAKELSEKGYYGVLEQYCTAMLAISCFLRKEADDLGRGSAMVDELKNWPAKNAVASYAIRLAEILMRIVQEPRSSNIQSLDALQAEVEKDTPPQDVIREVVEPTKASAREKAIDLVPYDHVIQMRDIENLLNETNRMARVK